MFKSLATQLIRSYFKYLKKILQEHTSFHRPWRIVKIILRPFSIPRSTCILTNEVDVFRIANSEKIFTISTWTMFHLLKIGKSKSFSSMDIRWKLKIPIRIYFAFTTLVQTECWVNMRKLSYFSRHIMNYLSSQWIALTRISVVNHYKRKSLLVISYFSLLSYWWLITFSLLITSFCYQLQKFGETRYCPNYIQKNCLYSDWLNAV